MGAVEGEVGVVRTPIGDVRTRPGATRLAGAVRRTAEDRRLLTLIDQVLVSATTFATSVLVGRTCTPAEFGLYMLGLTVLLLMTEAQASLISTPYMVRAPRLTAGSLARASGTSLLLQFGLAGSAALAVVTAALLGGLVLPGASWPPLAAALAATLPIALLREHLRRLSLSSFDFRGLLRTDAVASVTQVGALGVLVATGNLTPATALIAIGAGSALGTAMWAAGRTVRIQIIPRLLRAEARRYARIGGWIFASGMAWAFALHIFPWLLAALRGPEATGVWAACFGVASVANPLLLALANWRGPSAAHTLARSGADDLRRSTRRSATAVAIAMAPVVAAAFLWGDLLVQAIYGATFAGNGAVVGWLMLHVAATAVGIPASRSLFAMRRADADFRASAVQAIIAVGLGIVLVGSRGVLGAAAALAASSTLSSFLRIRAFARVGTV